MNTKCIFTPFVARKVLGMGKPRVDVERDKNNEDRTVFVFENGGKLKKDMVSGTQR